MKLFNNTVSVFVIAVVALIIIPLPTPLLDFMFVGNLTLSFIILLTTMYIRESLEFSIYPSILLITTLFRLALNISSTRSILTKDGYAGEVVKTFGEFVIQGNVVVGLVIFLIIVLVQFLVITKGSERVAEVSARFTLDAMPGKQMAIDADLSSGLIDEQEARTRRSKIQREADFFGAMDGATKFVKGDSIMSIVTTFINLIGGVIVGFINNVGSFSEIMSIYSTSTVGDGLMSQIPALLISVATGMIVTRSASEANLNEDISSQLFSQPRVLIMAGMAMLCTMFIGFPKAQVTTVSIAMIALGLILMRQSSVRQAAAAATDAGPVPMEEVTNEAAFYKNIDNVYNLLNVDQISMEFGYSLIPLVDEASGGSFVDRVVMFRKQFAQEMGMVFPSVRLKDSGQLNPNQYAISIKGEQVAQGEVLTDHYLALMPADGDDTVDGIETVEPAFGIPARWISEDKRVKAELAGYTLIDPTSVIITHLSEVVKAHAHELLNRQETNNMLANLRKSNEAIVNDTVPAIVSVGNLQKILCNLLQEGVPIRDTETILETLADYGATVKDIDMLTEYVRQSLRRTITHRFSEAGQLKVISLDGNIENQIMGSVKKVESGSYLALDPQTIQAIISSTTREVDKIRDLVPVPIILTSPIVRIYFKKLVDQFYLNAVVLSFNEIDSDVKIQALGNITI
ncbi:MULTISPECIES: flagellar biosynthesis protein FlhA [unclassified Anaerotruncus]|uniref:flagellar biosynthesis protein FlhA n=1 Tax=unclassified Anaerotruncus TaxID=2641626 RepID=UPI000334F2B3|nr:MULTISPECIES: flagellar biosynthesis protein FlhA [unclassified Anaerotruncus]MCI9161392.1 flagellar biosynthesis protein FlhA [Anaerotruncus sp.]NCE75850.1 flagellar biosynthesis protein FlhA [Anaerotruncus sp. X29]RKJ77343.1 flagellar biosynthesis protein FlhA [Anaerotruncus sp. 1XD22-93]EOS55213.1 flagellar biosynthesis protein FlhA [Anaerotruncus sp. G3(2012)]MCI9236676.1 flagellar biosynthesis protein FlhA [Anaerotruncus sp.]